MREALNQTLIKALKTRLLEDVSLVEFIMNTLSIGKEAAYRRLRGDVPFSFYEVVLIAKEVGLSLDQIAGQPVSNEAMFALNVQKTEDPLDYIYNICRNFRDIYLYIIEDPTSVMHSALNNLPIISHTGYPMLTKFRLYRWLHILYGVHPAEEMKNTEIPIKLITILSEICELQRCIPKSYVLWDPNVFKSLVQDIQYYININTISSADLHLVKEELLTILSGAEQLAFDGQYDNGNKVYLYIANIYFGSSYIYLEKKDFELSIFNLYSIDYIHSQHPVMCREQKKWIESLKKYSTLITQCGEKHRLDFFKKQRLIVESLTG